MEMRNNLTSEMTLPEAEQMVREEGTVESLLIYADQLVTADDPLGELIQAECALKNNSLDVNQQVSLRRRAGILNAKIKGEFARQFPTLTADWDCGLPINIYGPEDYDASIGNFYSDLHRLSHSRYGMMVQSCRCDSEYFEEVSVLSGFTNLKTLDLFRSGVYWLGGISSLKKLDKLELAGSPVSDLSPLSEVTSLTYLSLGRTGVVDVYPLSYLKKLQKLSLHYCRVKDIGALSGLTELTQLYISGTHVADLSPLKDLPNLQYLEIKDCRAKDTSMLKQPGLEIKQ